MKAVIMCGGSGTRLWPISRKSTPKQFVRLFGEKSLFELTIDRNINLVDEFIIVVNKDQLKICQKQVPLILKDKVTFIVEPKAKNTAPAITLAALHAKTDSILVLASDHLIEKQDEYEKCIHDANQLAKSGKIVTFGITPDYAETGYGYIEAKGNEVISFKEKPDIATAQDYLKRGNYFWNSGMFLFETQTYLKELEKCSPEILEKTQMTFEQSKKDKNVIYPQLKQMDLIPEDSIDYAVMEKSSNVAVIPSHFSWSDLGSYDSLYNEFQKDNDGNVSLTSSYIKMNSQNNLIISEKELVATFDIKNLIIVETEDALLIGKRGKSQNVKTLLQKIKRDHSKLLD